MFLRCGRFVWSLIYWRKRVNREIKFRALELDTGRWVYGYYVAEHGYYMNNGVPDLNKPVVRHYIIGDGGKHDICEETVCQFTGMKDKVGTDIYERDIVKSYFYGDSFNDVADIEYDESAAAFVYGGAEQDAFVYGAENDQLEVVGNMIEKA